MQVDNFFYGNLRFFSLFKQWRTGRGRLGHMHDIHKMTERRSMESLNFIGHCLVVLEYSMLHINFQGHQPFGSREGDFLMFLPYMGMAIYVIFSWAEIGRSAIFDREIGVPDREIFSRQKVFNFSVKYCYLQHCRSL